MTDRVYVEVSGCNCTIDGEHGYVTGFQKDMGHLVGAFIHVPPTVAGGEDDALLYVDLGARSGERLGWAEVTSSRKIDRDEFDRITGLDTLRRDMGWRDIRDDNQNGDKA